MSPKKIYQYLFYKIYRFFESLPTVWWSDSKALTSIIVLSSYIIFAFGGYLRLSYPRLDLFPNKFVVISIVFILFAINYYLFMYKDKWKLIVKEFDKLPKKKNKIGSWLVFLFICSLFINLIYSFYLGSQIDWSQYR